MFHLLSRGFPQNYLYFSELSSLRYFQFRLMQEPIPNLLGDMLVSFAGTSHARAAAKETSDMLES